ncbi:MAG TPA: 2-dehydro-3-deoxygalactonokinase [Flavilitoribacter sp.]|nr:2-dehydro-3-deoxygalactonokinase [Flavilitoribacter sp.]HMQ86889.1 2-dehydro-3-deoxygalactonokinase [Flavilitoribacter sp.]
MIDYFLSCDWGTSAFRMKLAGLSAGARTIYGAVRHRQGIKSTFKAWQESGGPAADRQAFYTRIIKNGIAELEKLTGLDLTGVPVVVSGMASSSIGMIDLPYKALPFRIDGSDLEFRPIALPGGTERACLLISGARTPDDVMRGEETLLVGAAAARPSAETEGLYVFPGTHSKHIHVKNGWATGFRTYMTGEIFELLSRQSTLSQGINAEEKMESPDQNEHFRTGVRRGITGNLLNQAFHTRAWFLADPARRSANFHFLSGLLIGAEIRDLLPDQNLAFTVVADGVLARAYGAALAEAGLAERATFLDTEEALLDGQAAILRTATGLSDDQD